ncbi:MAG: biopolymer transporter ExbD [Sutterellaceae bacterium]|nr:biopolymer transporter ExbD [Sutterellaceae bacterium]
MGPNFFDSFDEEPQIDLTPLIDCLFMLIIFFVLTMSFSRPVLEIILPEAKNATAETQRDEILLSVKADGSLFIGDEPVTLSVLEQRLDREPTKLLNIFMDEKAPFASFVSVVDLAKLKRAGKFVISTREPGDVSGTQPREDTNAQPQDNAP